jgi:hypothetical protein
MTHNAATDANGSRRRRVYNADNTVREGIRTHDKKLGVKILMQVCAPDMQYTEIPIITDPVALG